MIEVGTQVCWTDPIFGNKKTAIVINIIGVDQYLIQFSNGTRAMVSGQDLTEGPCYGEPVEAQVERIRLVLSGQVGGYETIVVYYYCGVGSFPGETTSKVKITIDGILVGEGVRFPNIETFITLDPRQVDGLEHTICADEICMIFTSGTLPCDPNWRCILPLNGYEYDGCGNKRLNYRCDPCVPSWVCELPLNGYEMDGCGNRRLNAACNPCIPSWQCEIPLNGYESDGCGNRRLNAACDTLPGTGSVQFITVPTDADVYLDGTPQGARTPATITNLSSGYHTYKLVLAGYKDATGTFTIEAGTTTTLSVSLTKAEAAAGAGTILGISLLGLGILGAVIVATREKKPEYTLPGTRRD